MARPTTSAGSSARRPSAYEGLPGPHESTTDRLSRPHDVPRLSRRGSRDMLLLVFPWFFLVLWLSGGWALGVRACVAVGCVWGCCCRGGRVRPRGGAAAWLAVARRWAVGASSRPAARRAGRSAAWPGPRGRRGDRGAVGAARAGGSRAPRRGDRPAARRGDPRSAAAGARAAPAEAARPGGRRGALFTEPEPGPVRSGPGTECGPEPRADAEPEPVRLPPGGGPPAGCCLPGGALVAVRGGDAAARVPRAGRRGTVLAAAAASRGTWRC